LRAPAGDEAGLQVCSGPSRRGLRSSERIHLPSVDNPQKREPSNDLERIKWAPSRAEAVRVFEECMALQPSPRDQAELRLALGFLFQVRPPAGATSITDRSRDAREQYLLALAIPGPHQSRAHNYVAYMSRSREQRDEVERHLRAALRRAEAPADVVFARWALTDHLNPVHRPLDAAPEIDSQRIKWAPSRAEAVRVFEEYMALQPSPRDQAELRLALGFWFQVRPPAGATSIADRSRDAREQYLLALAIPGPHQSRAHTHLAELLSRLNDQQDEVERHLRAGLRSATDHVDALSARRVLIDHLIAVRRPLDAVREIYRYLRLQRRFLKRQSGNCAAFGHLVASLHKYRSTGAAKRLVRGRVDEIMRLPDALQRAALHEVSAAQLMPIVRLTFFPGVAVPSAIDTSDLEILFPPGSKISPDAVREHGFLSSQDATLHITAAEPPTRPLFVRAHSFTRAALRAIRRIGGAAIRIRHARSIRPQAAEADLHAQRGPRSA
jgi:hypothetical protein